MEDEVQTILEEYEGHPVPVNDLGDQQCYDLTILAEDEHVDGQPKRQLTTKPEVQLPTQMENESYAEQPCGLDRKQGEGLHSQVEQTILVEPEGMKKKMKPECHDNYNLGYFTLWWNRMEREGLKQAVAGKNILEGWQEQI